MLSSIRLSIVFVLFTAAPALAQGTPQQRAACTDDAFKFCSAQIPDASAVEKCLRANMGGLSSACRREFHGRGKAKRR